MSSRVHSRYVHVKDQMAERKAPFATGPTKARTSSAKLKDAKAKSKEAQKQTQSTASASASAAAVATDKKQDFLDKKFANYLEEKANAKNAPILAERPKWGQNRPQKTKEDSKMPSYTARNSSLTRKANVESSIRKVKSRNVPSLSTSSDDEETAHVNPRLFQSAPKKADDLRSKTKQSIEAARMYLDSDNDDSAIASDTHHSIKNPFIVPGFTTKSKSPSKIMEETESSDVFSIPKPFSKHTPQQAIEKADEQMKANRSLLEDAVNTSSSSSAAAVIPANAAKVCKKEKTTKLNLTISNPISFTTSDTLSEEIDKLMKLVDALKIINEDLKTKRDKFDFPQLFMPTKGEATVQHTKPPVLMMSDEGEDSDDIPLPRIMQKSSPKKQTSTVVSPQKMQKSPPKKQPSTVASPQEIQKNSPKKQPSTVTSTQVVQSKQTQTPPRDENNFSPKEQAAYQNTLSSDLYFDQLESVPKSPSIRKPSDIYMDDSEDENEEETESHSSSQIPPSSKKHDEEEPSLLDSIKCHLQGNSFSPLSKKQISSSSTSTSNKSDNETEEDEEDEEDDNEDDARINQKQKEQQITKRYALDDESSDDIPDPVKTSSPKHFTLSPAKEQVWSSDDDEEESFVEEHPDVHIIKADITKSNSTLNTSDAEEEEYQNMLFKSVHSSSSEPQQQHLVKEEEEEEEDHKIDSDDGFDQEDILYKPKPTLSTLMQQQQQQNSKQSSPNKPENESDHSNEDEDIKKQKKSLFSDSYSEDDNYKKNLYPRSPPRPYKPILASPTEEKPNENQKPAMSSPISKLDKKQMLNLGLDSSSDSYEEDNEEQQKAPIYTSRRNPTQIPSIPLSTLDNIMQIKEQEAIENGDYSRRFATADSDIIEEEEEEEEEGKNTPTINQPNQPKAPRWNIIEEEEEEEEEEKAIQAKVSKQTNSKPLHINIDKDDDDEEEEFNQRKEQDKQSAINQKKTVTDKNIEEEEHPFSKKDYFLDNSSGSDDIHEFLQTPSQVITFKPSIHETQIEEEEEEEEEYDLLDSSPLTQQSPIKVAQKPPPSSDSDDLSPPTNKSPSYDIKDDDSSSERKREDWKLMFSSSSDDDQEKDHKKTPTSHIIESLKKYGVSLDVDSDEEEEETNDSD